MRRGSRKARTTGLAMRFHASETQCAEGEIRLISGYVAGTFVAAPKHWGLEWVWPARGWQSKELQDQGRLTMARVPIMGGITVFSVYFYHTEEWTERNQQRRRAERFGGAQGYGF